MSEMRFSDEHEWVRLDGDVGTIGVTKYAVEQLGDVVFVELPEKGAGVEKGNQVAVVESVKSASEIYTPVSGEIVGINTTVTDEPGAVNDEPEGRAWLFQVKLSDPSEIKSLMTAEQYEAFVKGL